MSFELEKAVFPVICSDTTQGEFGTAFVIFRSSARDRLYLLTCAHVVRRIEEKGRVWVYPYVTRVIAATPEKDTDDLALIEISREMEETTKLPPTLASWAEDRFNQAEALPLAAFGVINQSCSVYGYYEYIRKTHYNLKKLEGTLSDKTQFTSREQVHTTTTWEITFKGEKIALRAGYSGSPVMNDAGTVVAVTRIKEDQYGRHGRAVCLGALPRLAAFLPAGYDELEAMIQSTAQPGFAPPVVPDPEAIKALDCGMLPYLADRKSQLTQFTKIVDAYLSKIDTPPIICFLHGKEYQRIDKFIASLEKHHWKARGFTPQKRAQLGTRYLGLSRVRFEDYEDFKESLLDELRPGVTASTTLEYDFISKSFNRCQNKPFLVYAQVHSDEWMESKGQILDFFIRFWREWPRRKKGCLLFACLAIKYIASPPPKRGLGNILARFKPKTDTYQTITDQLAQAKKKHGDLPVFIFDELGDIDRRVAINWSQLDAIKTVCGSYDFEPYIRDLFHRQERMPMEDFAKEMQKELRKVLNNCL